MPLFSLLSFPSHFFQFCFKLHLWNLWVCARIPLARQGGCDCEAPPIWHCVRIPGASALSFEEISAKLSFTTLQTLLFFVLKL